MTSYRNTSADDHVLVERAMGGDSIAFEQLCSDYEAYIKTVICTRWNSLSNGIINLTGLDDLFHETLISVWKSRNQLSNPAKFRPWLAKIANNTTRDYLKSQNRYLIAPMYIASNPRNSLLAMTERIHEGDSIERKEALGALEEVIEELDELNAEIVRRTREGVRQREIAEMYDLTVDAVQKRLSRSRQEIAVKMRTRGFDSLRIGMPVLIGEGLKRSHSETTTAFSLVAATSIITLLLTGIAAGIGIRTGKEAGIPAGATDSEPDVVLLEDIVTEKPRIRKIENEPLIRKGDGVDGWTPVNPGINDTPPVRQTRHVKPGSNEGIVILNPGGVQRLFPFPVKGEVEVNYWIRPTAVYGMDFEVGLITELEQPYQSLLWREGFISGYYYKKGNYLDVPRDERINTPKWMRSHGWYPFPHMSREEFLGHEIRIRFSTETSTYDLFFNGLQVAKQVQAVGIEGQAIKGVFIRGYDKNERGHIGSVFISDLEAKVIDGAYVGIDKSDWKKSYQSPWMKRSPQELLNDIKIVIDYEADYKGARTILEYMKKQYRGYSETLEAIERYEPVFEWYDQTASDADQYFDNLMNHVYHLQQHHSAEDLRPYLLSNQRQNLPRDPTYPELVEATTPWQMARWALFEEWAIRHANVNYIDYHSDQEKVYLSIPKYAYRGSKYLFDVAEALTVAYAILNPVEDSDIRIQIQTFTEKPEENQGLIFCSISDIDNPLTWKPLTAQ